MPWKSETLTREKLYNLVWDRPLKLVDKTIGVSGVALGKTCRRLGIPVAGRARKAAGARKSAFLLCVPLRPSIREA